MRNGSARRTSATCRIAGWYRGAKMKPIPVSRMQRATSAGGSIRAPSASRTSALPQREVLARLPCLAMRAPRREDEHRGGGDVEQIQRVAPGAADVAERRPQLLTGTRTIFSRITDAIAASARGCSRTPGTPRGTAPPHTARTPPPPSVSPPASRPAPGCRAPPRAAGRSSGAIRSPGFAGAGRARELVSYESSHLHQNRALCLPPVYHTGPPIIPLRRYPARGRRASSPATGRYLL